MSPQAITLRSEIAPPRLDQLAASIRQHHQTVLDSLRRTLESAIVCGEALAEAKQMIPAGMWLSWLAENVSMDWSSARLYIRIAHFREELCLVGIDSISAAQKYLRENDLVLKVSQHPDEKVVEVIALGQEGLSTHQIARKAGVPRTTVDRWLKQGPRAPRLTTGERPPKPAPKPVEITDEMIEGMARWLAVRTGDRLTDEIRARATEALRVALNYKKRKAG